MVNAVIEYVAFPNFRQLMIEISLSYLALGCFVNDLLPPHLEPHTRPSARTSVGSCREERGPCGLATCGQRVLLGVSEGHVGLSLM